MTAAEPKQFKDALVYGEQAHARTLGELVLQKKKTMYSDLFSIFTPLKMHAIYRTVELQKIPFIFLSYCVSKLLMWMVPVKDEIVMKYQSIQLKEEDLENGSFELYIRYNLLQFLSQDEIYIFRRYSYEQESPFTVLHDIIAIKIIEGLKSVGFSEVTEQVPSWKYSETRARYQPGGSFPCSTHLTYIAESMGGDLLNSAKVAE